MAAHVNESFEGLCAACVMLLHGSLEGIAHASARTAVDAHRSAAVGASRPPFASTYVNSKQVRDS
jgi:hypothetical protein